MPRLSPTIQKLLAASLFVALFPLLGLSEIALKERYVQGRRILPPDTYSLPDARVLRTLTFGYNELAADMVWVRTIAYFADHFTTDRDLRYLNRYLRTVVALDPYSKHAYRYGAPMLVNQGRRTNQDILAAIALLKQAHRLFPDDWRFPLSIGGYYINELHSHSKKERSRWRLQGGDWIRRAMLVGASVPWLPALAAKMYTEQGRRDLAILHLKELYHAAQTEKMKRQIAAKLRQLHAARIADDLRSTAASLKQALKASPISFVGEDMFVLTGLPPLSPFSLKTIAQQQPEQLLR